MTVLSRVTRLLLPALAAPPLVLALAAPVAAVPPAGTLAVIASSDMVVGVLTSGLGFRVCVTGRLDDAPTQVVGTWHFVLAGVRGGVPFTEQWSTPAFDVSRCADVTKGGASVGHFSVDFGYTAAGTYVFAHSHGGGTWGVLGDQPYSVNPTR